MIVVNVHQAKSQLSKLLDAVEDGDEVIITRRGKGVGRFRIELAPIPDRSKMFGILKGKIIDYDEADREMTEIWDEYFEKLESEE
jgi:antitoxin (DNA-binding transcriptional repressor) of toxin-antitoxin stability system